MKKHPAVNGENYQKQKKITDEINAFISEIKRDTGMFSTHNHIFEHPRFKQLVEMGDKIVDYIFYLMFEHGSDWVLLHLLNMIVKENKPIIPKEHRGSFVNLTVDWEVWFLQSDYHKNHDIYYGLVEDEKPIPPASQKFKEGE